MDLSPFGLDRSPFDNTPNPGAFVNLAPHRRAAHTLQYAIENRKGLVLVTGLPGAGKTTLVRTVRRRLGQNAACATLARPCAGPADLGKAVADAFRINARKPAGQSPIHDIEQWLLHLYEQDVPAVLIVDNAHDMPDDALQLLRQFAALEADDMPLLQLVLVGWPKLTTRFLGLAGTGFKQRVYRHLTLEPLTDPETELYIRARIRTAGGPEEDIFTADAIKTIHERTGGLPRLINWLCEALLEQAAEAQKTTIDADDVKRIRFEAGFEEDTYDSQTITDEATALLDGRFKAHPAVKDLAARIERLEATAGQHAAHNEQLRAELRAIERQLRRYERVFGRMLPVVRTLRQFREEAGAVLDECRAAGERLQGLLHTPESVLNQAVNARDQLREVAQQARDLCNDARQIFDDTQKQRAVLRDEAENTRQTLHQQFERGNTIAQAIATQRAETQPDFDRIRKAIRVLRKVHSVTTNRTDTLDDLTQRAEQLDHQLEQRLEQTAAELDRQLERVAAELERPTQLMERLRAADGILRRRLEAGQEQTRAAQKLLEKAVQTVRRMRETIEQAHDIDDARRARENARGPDDEIQADVSLMARRVCELQNLVESMDAREPTPEPETVS